VSLGFFDGVHLGHQQILRQTLAEARQHEALALAITFDRHPNTVVAPERAPGLIYHLSQRLRAIGTLGLDTTLLLHFDHAFSQQPAEQFVTDLVSDLRSVRSINIGRNFTFGHIRSGNVTLLQALGARLGFEVADVPPISCRGHIVSSTRCRQAIQAGDLDAVSEMLGRPYSIAGEVIAGERLGRKLGFPTANVDVAGLIVPQRAVYAGWALFQNRRCPAVTNIGFRPTLNQRQPELRVEVHVLDFNDELYGQELEFQFVSRLRGEEKFGSLPALQQQIESDIAEARRRLLVGESGKI